jgi:ssDNA thymidine ADP-ribosyltransferase, DarT
MTAIYHITHVANLSTILRENGLICDAEAELRGLCQQSIAYDSIKERRKRRRVETLKGQPVSAGGVVADSLKGN